MRPNPYRKALIALSVLALGVAGCASGGGGGAQGATRNRIVRAELQNLGGELNGREAVEQLRSLWLRGVDPVVYVDGTRSSLDRYQADEIQQMEYLDPQQAELRYGTGHTGGAILVTTLLAGGGGGGGGGGVDLASLLGGGGSTTLAQGESPRETGDTRRAADALDDEQYQQALAAAEAAIAADPRNPLAHRLAARAYMGLGDYGMAGQHFDHAVALRPIYQLELAPMREQAYIEKYEEATPSLDAGDYAAAAEVFEDANAIYPARPEALILLAQLYTQLQRYDLAVERMEQVEAFMSSTAMQEADSATAAGWREQAAPLPLLKARVLSDAGRLDEAIAAYREVAMAAPNDLDVQQELAGALMQNEQLDEALAVYERLAARPGVPAEVLYNVGLGFHQGERYADAAEALSRVVAANPTDRDALEWWARALAYDEAFTQVPPVTQQWLELDPASQQAMVMQAQAQNANGNAQAAQAAIQRAEALPFAVDNLQLRRRYDGGGTISGTLGNRTLAEGTPVTLRFTYYGRTGSSLGTVEQSIAASGQGMNAVFNVPIETTEYVGGYSYEIGGG